MDQISNIQRGFEIGRNLVKTTKDMGDLPFITGSNVNKYVHTSVSYISRETYMAYAKEDYYYTGERLLIRGTGSSLTVAIYENDKLYSNRSLYSIKIKDSRYEVKYVLACLNSKACQYYYSSKFKSETELFPKIRIKQARTLPIPAATPEKQQTIINLVNGILDIKKTDFTADTQKIENNIDLLVYQLYGLTYDEVLVIDPETPITKNTNQKCNLSLE